MSVKKFLKVCALALVIALPVSLASSGARAEATEAEITFWNSVKDSKNADELNAYLRAFPNGTFSALAKIRLRKLKAGGGTSNSNTATRTTTPNPNAELTDRNQILFVQRFLYELNFGDELNFPDGKIGRKTRETVRDYQRKRKLAVTGKITRSLYKRAKNAKLPSVTWAGVGGRTRSGSAVRWGMDTREETARALLRAGCKGRRNKCIVSTDAVKKSGGQRWIGFIRCKRTRGTRTNYFIASDSATKEGALRDDLRERARNRGWNWRHCRVVGLVEANGRHR